MPKSLQEAITSRVVSQLSKNTLAVLVGNLLAFLVIGFYYWWLTGQTFYMAWIPSMALVLVLRSGLIALVSNASPERINPRQQHDLLCVGMLVTGLGWSIMAQYAFLYSEPAQLTILYVALAGLVSASLVTAAGSMSGFTLFSMPILLPMAALHIALGTSEQMVLGSVILVYAAVMVVAAHYVGGFIREAITYNFENRELLDSLVKDKEHIMLLNERLSHDLKKRVGVMEWLASGRRDQGDMSEEMHVLASKDALTGLANRRRFNEMITADWARARRDHSSVALIKCDVDHFKAFNDALGQQEGDLCLATLANCLAKFARRTTDLVARYGEDEFVVLLPGIGEADAIQIAEEIRAAVEQQAIPHPSSTGSAKVTLTLGVAAITPNRQITEMTLIKQADIALYRAKQTGRNQVASYSQSDSQTKVTLRDLIKPPAGQ